jgi:hypothetical protein
MISHHVGQLVFVFIDAGIDPSESIGLGSSGRPYVYGRTINVMEVRMKAKIKCVYCKHETSFDINSSYVTANGRVDVVEVVHVICIPAFKKLIDESKFTFTRIDNSDPSHLELWIQLYNDVKQPKPKPSIKVCYD